MAPHANGSGGYATGLAADGLPKSQRTDFQVDAANVTYSDADIVSKYRYRTTAVRQVNGQFTNLGS